MSLYDYLFKYIIIGDSGVGKSCILTRYIDNKFQHAHDITIGVDFGTKTIKLKGKNIKLQLWDTAGQEAFQSITHSYYRSSLGVLIVYDISKRSSFENLQKWIDCVSDNILDNVKVVLIGNKSDLNYKRRVSFSEGKRFAENRGFLFFETSAMDDKNIDSIFRELTLEVYENLGSVNVTDIHICSEKVKDKYNCCK